MEVLDGSAISELVFKRYARNPTGWSFTISPSRSHGFYDALVAGPEESWQLKIDTIFKPSPLVVGSRSESDLRGYAASAPLSFGYREIGPRTVREIESRGEATPGLAELLSRLVPVVPEQGKAYAHGPFVLAREAVRMRDRSQVLADEKLSSRM
ncbi:MAG: hypothetical protein ABSF83_10920, partial [Nitrososphaerales archaeon]